jgi:hypothetical protein
MAIRKAPKRTVSSPPPVKIDCGSSPSRTWTLRLPGSLFKKPAT